MIQNKQQTSLDTAAIIFCCIDGLFLYSEITTESNGSRISYVSVYIWQKLQPNASYIGRRLYWIDVADVTQNRK